MSLQTIPEYLRQNEYTNMNAQKDIGLVTTGQNCHHLKTINRAYNNNRWRCCCGRGCLESSKSTWMTLEKDTTWPEPKRWLIRPPVSVFTCMPQQFYQPSALINACLWDSALQLSRSRYPPPLRHISSLSASFLTYFPLEVLQWFDRTRSDRPGEW